MKKIVYLLTLSAFVFTGCNPNEDINATIDAQENVIVGDVVYTLTDDDYDDLDDRVQESLDAVPVKVLVCDDEEEREEIIEEILSTIHLTPPQQWGALQQAFALHQKYVKLLNKEFFMG